jgi:hypothetical protein
MHRRSPREAVWRSAVTKRLVRPRGFVEYQRLRGGVGRSARFGLGRG